MHLFVHNLSHVSCSLYVPLPLGHRRRLVFGGKIVRMCSSCFLVVYRVMRASCLTRYSHVSQSQINHHIFCVVGGGGEENLEKEKEFGE